MKPTYYLDKVLWTQIRAETREFYVALWGIADDAGWFEWDVTSIGAVVYTFVPVARREREIMKHAALLASLEPSAPHLVIHACGHAQVPKMPQHQRLSGPTKRVTTDADRHERGKCPVPRTPAGPRGSPQMPDTVGNGRERNGTEMESAREGFKGKMAAHGLKGEIVQ